MNLQNPSLFCQDAFINNEFIPTDSGERIDVFNPFGNQVIGSIPALSTEQVHHAIEQRATDAKNSWQAPSANGRTDLLHR